MKPDLDPASVLKPEPSSDGVETPLPEGGSHPQRSNVFTRNLA